MIRQLAALLLAASSCSSVAIAEPAEQAKPVASSYFPANEDADFAVETGISEARESGRIAVIVFGADWCHDSQFLARLIKSPQFQTDFGGRFYFTFVDVGTPQVDRGRNLDLVARFGLEKMRNTPAVFFVAGDGKPLNSPSDARSWKDAEAWGEARVRGKFSQFIAQQNRLRR
jgi:hypothetical protein